MNSRFLRPTAGCLAFAAAVGAFAQNAISVTVDDQPLIFPGTGPQMVNGRVLVPLRGIFERLGAHVGWNAARQEVNGRRGRSDVDLIIGNSSAVVDGHPVTLDVPPQIVGGSTMVPIRFVSESLGCDVKWNEALQLVSIRSAPHDRTIVINPPPVVVPPPPIVVAPPRPRPGPMAELIVRDTVIPCALDDTLRSNGSRPGDTFTATILTQNSQMYGYLPAGSRLNGKVIASRPQRGPDPGLLELQFTSILLPDGSAYGIDGRLIDLNDPNVARDSHGVMFARGGGGDRKVFVGFGNGPGMVLRMSSAQPFATFRSGGVSIYLSGPQFDQSRPRDIYLRPGTHFGVRLMHDVLIHGRDLGH